MRLYGVCPNCGNKNWDSIGGGCASCTACEYAATMEEIWGDGCKGGPVRYMPETRPAQPENCNAPLDYDERDFAVCLSSRIFAKDIIRNRTNGDIGRRDYKRKQNMDALIASLRR